MDSLDLFCTLEKLYLIADGLERSFPIDNTADSGYDKHEINT